MIVTLAHSLGMDVVAEGIGTSVDLEGLRELGCEFGQGFLFAPPMAAQAVEQWLGQRELSEKRRKGKTRGKQEGEPRRWAKQSVPIKAS
ncbi:EAL domain-containing protein [Pseudanabaena sp. FACHB-2040]|uniref:EAL domain-containing protein n=1 Tax=Pseudanabaena sp. FACHB-2040 TaxID=2692859 RepID=UPI001683FC1F|nr:EAL domain-containing protein [Pseudanabaena sp. FACHB-2040]MBD2259450.1 EAL domain-containing protein [Pseudanabaena sp. FACHB-2040]